MAQERNLGNIQLCWSDTWARDPALLTLSATAAQNSFHEFINRNANFNIGLVAEWGSWQVLTVPTFCAKFTTLEVWLSHLIDSGRGVLHKVWCCHQSLLSGTGIAMGSTHPLGILQPCSSGRVFTTMRRVVGVMMKEDAPVSWRLTMCQTGAACQGAFLMPSSQQPCTIGL